MRTHILLLAHLAAHTVLLAHLHRPVPHRVALVLLDRILQAMVRHILVLLVKAPHQAPPLRQHASLAQQGRLPVQEVSVRLVLPVKSLL
jgi:hypothetical protein